MQRVAVASVRIERNGLRVTEDSRYQVAIARIPETEFLLNNISRKNINSRK